MPKPSYVRGECVWCGKPVTTSYIPVIVGVARICKTCAHQILSTLAIAAEETVVALHKDLKRRVLEAEKAKHRKYVREEGR